MCYGVLVEVLEEVQASRGPTKREESTRVTYLMPISIADIQLGVDALAAMREAAKHGGDDGGGTVPEVQLKKNGEVSLTEIEDQFYGAEWIEPRMWLID